MSIRSIMLQLINNIVSGGYSMLMAVSRSDWDKLVELWAVSEIASTISKALISLYILKMGAYEPEINTELLQNIGKCEGIISKILRDIELYINGRAPETMLVTLLIDAYGDVDVEKIRDSLLRAVQGLSKLVDMLRRGVVDECVLKDKDVLESENVLRKLSDALSKRVGQIASEIYTF